jgi:hypothetical protein
VLRAARFVRAFYRPPGELLEEEVEVTSGEVRMPATLLRPATSSALPGRVLLHGITVPGREHGALRRFAQALAASGNVVLIPEIREWSELRIAPARAEQAIRAAAAFLAPRAGVLPGGVGVIGFSFGATQALICASRDDLDADIRSVVSFGGYCDLQRTVRFAFTGEHEWGGVVRHLSPDPYGRWIVVGNYLTDGPGYGSAGPVAEAALELAREAGRRGAYAGSSEYGLLKRALREGLAPELRPLWDLVAPPGDLPTNRDGALELADALVDAALVREPELDPRPFLPSLARPAVLAHGRADHLIPFTETLRLRSRIPPDVPVRVYVTRLFAHSGGADALPRWRYPTEALHYLRLLAAALRV